MMRDENDGRFGSGGQIHSVAAQPVAVYGHYMHWLPENRDIALKGNLSPWEFFEVNPPDHTFCRAMDSMPRGVVVCPFQCGTSKT